MRMWKNVTMLVAGLMLAGVPAAAQQDDDFTQRVAEARERLAEAQRQLEELEAEGDFDEVDRVLRELREAQRLLREEMRRERWELRRVPGENLITLLGAGRPRMGVVVQTDPDAEDAGGAKITAVTPGGPAADAGMQSGDIIVSINGEELVVTGDRRSAGDRLVEIVRGAEEGDTLRVTYRRDGEKMDGVVVLRPMGDEFAYAFAGDSLERFEFVMPEIRMRELGPQVGERIRARVHRMLPVGWLDMELSTLDAELGAYFGTSEGLLVVKAPDEESLNLKSGDVILRIDGRTPTSPSHALRILRSYEAGESLELDVMRNKQRLTVTATVPEMQGGFFWRDR